MNIWHDINQDRIKTNDFVTVIEISKGSKAKYELDKETGMIALDRVLHTSMQYPANYGFIPRTLSEDGDPLDVLLLCSENIIPGALVRCKSIGAIVMIDDGEMDEKIIAVAIKDPFYGNFNSITDLPAHYANEIEHFLASYKGLEKGAKTEVKKTQGREVAVKLIDEAIERYNKKFKK